MANPKSLFYIFFINQYNDCNIRLKVFYNNIIDLLHYVIYTLTTGISTQVTSFLPIPPHWSTIILHMAHVFIDPTPAVPVKIMVPLTNPMVIIDNALASTRRHTCSWLNW